MTRPARPACIRFLPHRRKSFAQYFDGRDVGKFIYGHRGPRVADSTPLPVGPDGGGIPRPPDDNRLSKVDQTRLPGRLTASGPPARHGATAPFRETRSSLSTPSRIAVHHQGHHYITSRPQSTWAHLLLYTLTLSSSPATKLLGSLGLAAAAGRPGVAGHDFPSTAARRAGSATSETVPGRRRQGSAGAPRPDAVDHQQLNTTG